jgi:NADH-quinone oxidoreductase subunit C
VAEFDPLTISDEELKALPPAERAKVYKARAAARAGGAAPAAGAPAAPTTRPAAPTEPAAQPVSAAAQQTPAASAPRQETPSTPPAETGKAAAAPAAPARPAAPVKPAQPEKPKEPERPAFAQRILDDISESTFQWRHGYAELKVPREQLLDVAKSLREQGFDYLSLVTEVDWQDHLELVYHLFSYDYRAQSLGVILRTELPREGMPAVASLTPVYPGAEFMEREAFEMMGIRFLGHPDLRRILLPDDFKGFPMRRDFETDFDYITVKQLVRDTD